MHIIYEVTSIAYYGFLFWKKYCSQFISCCVLILDRWWVGLSTYLHYIVKWKFMTSEATYCGCY